MALYIECDELSDVEKQVRHELIYLFNPCLKFIFNQSPVFKEYAYNSCRQTAIFSYVFLMNRLPGSYTAYEGKFGEVLNSKYTEYEHAFVIRDYGSEKTLIDVSRTQRQLLFHKVDSIAYPKVKGYMKLKLLSYEKMNVPMLMGTDIPEFITNKKPIDVLCDAMTLMDKLKAKTKSEQISFASKIYNEMTEIGGEFV